MTTTVATTANRRAATHPRTRWWLVNVGLVYVGGLLTALIYASFENDQPTVPLALLAVPVLALFALASTLEISLPAVLVYIGILRRVPRTWSPGRRRAAAFAAAPVLIAVPFFTLGSELRWTFRLSLVIGAVVAAALVRVERPECVAASSPPRDLVSD